MASGGTSALSPVCAYVAERTGSSLSPQQVSRLRELLDVRLKSRGEGDYLSFLKTSAGAAELAELMSVIAVHKTDLFRDEVQLGAFAKHVLAPLVAKKRPLRLWSAGCATGEEVATLLILLEEAGAEGASTVTGSDISELALRQARQLSFHPELIRRVPRGLVEKYFARTEHGFALGRGLAERARFVRHNLMDLPYPCAPSGERFDVIFCRNVLIYFTDDAFDRVVGNLAEQLAPDGTLVLSAAEPILRVQPQLSTVRCENAFFYRRRQPGAPAPRLEAPRATTKPHPLSQPSAPWPSPAKATGGAGLAPMPPDAPPVPAEDPREEAVRNFQLVLDWAAAGESDVQTEQGLRRCLYLDPHFAQARYLLGMLLEQRGERADATSEYRRALAALNEGRSALTPFFLNDERLKVACAQALRRLGYARD